MKKDLKNMSMEDFSKLLQTAQANLEAKMAQQGDIECCICGKTIPVIKGNNPYPVRTYSVLGTSENRCCDDCNSRFVMFAREEMRKQCSTKKEEEEYHNKLKSMSYEELCEMVKK